MLVLPGFPFTGCSQLVLSPVSRAFVPVCILNRCYSGAYKREFPVLRSIVVAIPTFFPMKSLTRPYQ